MHVLVVMSDLLFKARISAAAEKVGSTVAFARTLEEAKARAGERVPELIVADLMLPAAWDVAREFPDTRALGLYHHVDLGTRGKAIAAGFVPMPNGEFVAKLPGVLA
ncbi:MAG: hypothetical protein ACYDCK_08720 [Thermoplasmatota archaeon]